MVRHIRLSRELIDEIVHGLRTGVVPEAWREMQVVLIPKPGKDLMVTKNWRPINLINCVEKLA